MRISKKTRQVLYDAIREEIVDVRIKLKLSPNDDFALAKAEIAIWKKQKRALGLLD